MYISLESRPDSYREWYEEGNLLRKQGHERRALACYERALEYNHQDYWAWYRKGTVLEKLGEYDEAVASYAQACNLKGCSSS